jgi:O-acetyl-ADP-ribose deacetylase (regulator of RNase III)
MIIQHQQDILQTDCRIIVHGCNAQGVMNAGLAKQIRDKWPQVYKDYMRMYTNRPINGSMLGSMIVTEVDASKFVVSAVTQEDYGYENRRYASYDAIDKIMISVGLLMIELGASEFAMAQLGCGLGGASWEVVKAIVNTHFGGTTVHVYYL